MGPDGRRLTARQLQVRADTDAWLQGRLLTAGAVLTRDVAAVTGADAEDQRAHVAVIETKPPFLRGRGDVTGAAAALVSVVRDATSDLAVIARTPPASLAVYREARERAGTRGREFWQLAGQRMGDAMGIARDAAAPAMDARAELALRAAEPNLVGGFGPHHAATPELAAALELRDQRRREQQQQNTGKARVKAEQGEDDDDDSVLLKRGGFAAARQRQAQEQEDARHTAAAAAAAAEAAASAVASAAAAASEAASEAALAERSLELEALARERAALEQQLAALAQLEAAAEAAAALAAAKVKTEPGLSSGGSKKEEEQELANALDGEESDGSESSSDDDCWGPKPLKPAEPANATAKTETGTGSQKPAAVSTLPAAALEAARAVAERAALVLAAINSGGNSGSTAPSSNSSAGSAMGDADGHSYKAYMTEQERAAAAAEEAAEALLAAEAAAAFAPAPVRSIRAVRESLPVYSVRAQLLQLVREHQVRPLTTTEHLMTHIFLKLD